MMNQLLNKSSRFAGFLAIGAMVFFSASCDKSENTDPNGPPVGNKEPIALECDFFTQDRILVDDPEAPVDYIISCRTKVKGKLTVEPGVVIAFTEDASMNFEESASLKMDGTKDKPIILTGKTPEKGLWRGVLIESTKPSNSMKYVTIEYAGSNSVSNRGGMSPAGLQVSVGGDVTIDHCTFQNCKDNGLYWNSSKNITITNSTFTKNDVPVKAWSPNAIKIFNNTNTYSGNVHDYVELRYPGISNEGKKITWRKIDVPYYIVTRYPNTLSVDKADLVIEPGVNIITATASTSIRIWSDASIRAVGTPSDPIIFRGENNVQASWGYIFIQSGSALNEIGHAQIKNAGNTMSDIQAAIQINYDAYLNIHDVSFTKNAGYAVGMRYHAGMPDPVITYENLTTDNGKLFCNGANGAELTDPNNP